jgi:tetratricopeptide (TPR) repeat protein
VIPLRFTVIALCALVTVSACSTQPVPAHPEASDRAGKSEAAAQLLAAGERLMAEGDWLRAEHYLAAAGRRGAHPARIVPLLVRACVESSRLRAALDHAEPYLETHPDDAPLRFVVAALYAALGFPERARDELEAVTRLDPGHARAEYALGELWAHAFGDRNAAARHFDRYLELAPRGPHAAEARRWLAEQAEQTERKEPAS